MRHRSTTVRTQHRKRQLPVRCASCGATGVKLYQDHIVNLAAGGADHPHNMQWLCGPCHDTKTKAERAAGRARAIARRGSISKRYRDREPHPGAL
ncbi:HNH endonuclease [Mycobacterium phage Mendokysei]|uniref:HNH endonuclease n=1 Tax=Mycobacterium phage Mendokysei TaxID=2099637 RepID=A0A2P1CGF1_9CAUD|nr:HNH endonuclease [Mycobacterium phage Mendokysei]AVJ50278.1 HNH endonuclease [Mycobacterium phage Mendokysei]